MTQMPEYAPRRSLARLRSAIGRHLFEHRLELDSAEFVDREELGLGNLDYQPYVPSQWFVLPRALRTFRPSSSDVFLDIGSGKGRVVIQAARYPFRRIIGVEISPALTAIAQGNLERNRARLACQEVDLVIADLTSYEPPPDVTMAYSFHALSGSALGGVLGRLATVADRGGRTIRFIYSNPLDHETVMATGRARLVRAYPARLHLRHPLHLYEIPPA